MFVFLSQGGRAKGPRGPKSYWCELPVKVRAQGLRVALTVKLAQDNLHIVDSLDLPSFEPEVKRKLQLFEIIRE